MVFGGHLHLVTNLSVHTGGPEDVIGKLVFSGSVWGHKSVQISTTLDGDQSKSCIVNHSSKCEDFVY